MLHIFSPSIIRGKQKLVVKEAALLCFFGLCTILHRAAMWLEVHLSARDRFGQSQLRQCAISVAFPIGKASPTTCETTEATGSPCVKSPVSLTWVPPTIKAVAQGKSHPAGRHPYRALHEQEFPG